MRQYWMFCNYQQSSEIRFQRGCRLMSNWVGLRTERQPRNGFYPWNVSGLPVYHNVQSSRPVLHAIVGGGGNSLQARMWTSDAKSSVWLTDHREERRFSLARGYPCTHHWLVTIICNVLPGNKHYECDRFSMPASSVLRSSQGAASCTSRPAWSGSGKYERHAPGEN